MNLATDQQTKNAPVIASRERWLVCGGRAYDDVDHIFDTLDALTRTRGVPEIVIHGAAQGADKFAGWWAKRRGVECKPYPVAQSDWKRYGKRAGPLRNKQMIEDGNPTLVIAFPGGIGTADMINQATACGIEVLLVAGQSLLGA